jgi:hypothetical protein
LGSKIIKGERNDMGMAKYMGVVGQGGKRHEVKTIEE